MTLISGFSSGPFYGSGLSTISLKQPQRTNNLRLLWLLLLMHLAEMVIGPQVGNQVD